MWHLWEGRVCLTRLLGPERQGRSKFTACGLLSIAPGSSSVCLVLVPEGSRESSAEGDGRPLQCMDRIYPNLLLHGSDHY